jgi:chitin disaccharide deacetylase
VKSAVPPARRRVVLCADDFGLSDAASRAILALAAANLITATSVAVDGPALEPHLAALRALRPRLAVGLHLNLTENPQFAGARTLPRWIIATCLRRGLDRAALATEIRRQLERFDLLLAGPPDFVDGHEHVHQFPVLRDLLLHELTQRYGTRVAVRCTVPQHFRGLKAGLIGRLGARALRRALVARGLKSNSDFAGVYDLRSAQGYGSRMDEWLRSIADGGLIMCHPEAPDDRTSAARAHEFAFLGSPEWPRLLRSWNVVLTPFRAA